MKITEEQAAIIYAMIQTIIDLPCGIETIITEEKQTEINVDFIRNEISILKNNILENFPDIKNLD